MANDTPKKENGMQEPGHGEAGVKAAAPAGGKGAHSGTPVEPQPPKKEKKRMSKTRRIILYVLIGLLAVFIVILGKYIYDITHPAALFAAGTVETPTPTPTAATPVPTASAAPTPTPTPDPEAILLSQADLDFMQNRVNIMILGIDESTERENWGSFRTDTMILVTINFDTNDVDMVSIPRDSYIKICNGEGRPIGKFGKANTAFPSGGGAKKNGYDYVMGTASYLFGGIPVNYYVGFNMNVVKEVVDAMGGVDYEVDIEVDMNGRELHPGYQHLDGQAVLDYCRQRKGSSDLARIDRQQRMLQAIFGQLKSTGQIVNIPDIYRAVEQNVQTNLTFTQISALALLALNMDMDQLGSHTLSGQSVSVRARSCIALSSSKIEALVKEIFGIDVRVDQDINYSAIKARLEAERAEIATELNAAYSAISQADNLLNNYGDHMTGDEKSGLTSARSRLKTAYDEEDKADLDAYTAPLSQWVSYVTGQLRARGVMVGAVQTPVPEITPAPDENVYIPEEFQIPEAG